MKKILIMFLLTFPILIFAIVTFSSTIIAYYVPIPVSSIKVISGRDIMAINKDEVHLLSFQIGPEGARDNSFKIYDEFGRIVVEYNDDDKSVEFMQYEDLIFSINNKNERIVDKGLVELNIHTTNFGFTRLTIVTRDGQYEDYSDIYVQDPSRDPSEILGIVFDYTAIHKDYLFGTEGNVKIGYTYYPKTAFPNLTEEQQNEINQKLVDRAKELTFKLTRAINRGHEVFGDGRGELTLELREGAILETESLTRNAKFEFNVNQGYNIYSFDDLNTYKTLGANLYLLNHIDIDQFITFTNGTKVYGNGFKLDHSNMTQYEEKDENGKTLYVGRYAIQFNGNNSGLYNTHVLGALDHNNQPYENIINVGFIARTKDDRYMEIKDNIIENGRVNLTVSGFSNRDLTLEDAGTTFIVDNNKLSGSFLTALEVDGAKSDAYLYYSTNVVISRTRISYTAIGVVIQNSRNDSGVLKVTFVKVQGIPAVISDSWRNLDDASGALNMSNMGYILKELKSSRYSHVYHREGKNYYVNPIVMIRGGITNRGIIEFLDDDFRQQLIEEIRTPSFIEAMHPSIGGTFPFTIYLLDPSYFQHNS